jgi:DNA polymerase-3 subunit epsilon
VLGQKAFPNSINHRLATLCSLLDIKVKNAHRALDDSIACQEVTFRCMEQLGGLMPLEFMFDAQGGAFLWPRYSVSELLNQELTKTLVEACRGQLVLEFTYQGGSKAGQPRRMTPQGLVRNPMGDYVVGLCHVDNRDKRFFINRILSARILD